MKHSPENVARGIYRLSDRCVSKAALGVLQGYRFFVSPLLGSNCRFYPSCSCYAQEAIERYGAIQGVRLALQRVLRCHPWHEGGYDPVPETPHTRGALFTSEPFVSKGQNRVRQDHARPNRG